MKKTFKKNEIGDIAREVLHALVASSQKQEATILALSGDLGAGKTTLTQAVARELGVTENVNSPTFVIMKSYSLKSKDYRLLVHIDAYRLASHTELEKLGWAELVSDPRNLIIIEWPERVAEIIPATAHAISLSHKNEEERGVQY